MSALSVLSCWEPWFLQSKNEKKEQQRYESTVCSTFSLLQIKTISQIIHFQPPSLLWAMQNRCAEEEFVSESRLWSTGQVLETMLLRNQEQQVPWMITFWAEAQLHESTYMLDLLNLGVEIVTCEGDQDTSQRVSKLNLLGQRFQLYWMAVAVGEQVDSDARSQLVYTTFTNSPAVCTCCWCNCTLSRSKSDI